MLDTAVTTRVPQKARKSAATPSLRRDLGEDFAPRRTSIAPVTGMVNEDEDFVPSRRFGGLRFRLDGGIPRSVIGRVLYGTAFLAVLAVVLGGAWEARAMLLANPRLVVPSSSAIQITGNSHLSRAQLLTVFGEDVDRNILTVPLRERRAELERLPWVEHATVMRLLPNRFRVAIVERKPVAFIRQGSSISLVDANGVLLDMTSDGDSDPDAAPPVHYSFPVVTGIAASDPMSVRASRMKLFTRFTHDLGDDAKNLSEVDLSSPEDVKALIPDGASDILVHFGDDRFLHRYQLYQKNLPGWKKDFPKMASADMRYEHQVVLEMQPGSSVPVSDAPATAPKPAADATTAPATPVPAKPAAKAKPAPKPAVKHLTAAFDVHAKPKTTPPQAPPQ